MDVNIKPYVLILVAFAIFSIGTSAQAQTASDFCGNEQGMANYYKVPYPARPSSAARSLITCIQLFISDQNLIDTTKIYTYQQDINLRLLNYTRGNRLCGITDVTCLANGGCHAVNSCHYGGRTGTDGAEGVDYNAKNSTQEAVLYDALKKLVYPGGACYGLAKYIGLEGNHTHLSTVADADCDSVNIPGISLTANAVASTTQKTSGTALGSAASLPNPIACKNLTCVLVSISKIVLGLLGLVATFMFIYGGGLYLTSAGNADTVRKATSTLLFSTLGLVLIIASWVIISTVFQVAITGTV